MQQLTVDIALGREQYLEQYLELYLELYRGYIRQVQALARNGQVVRFPVGVLVPFVTGLGVHGTFRLHFDAMHRFRRIERLADLPRVR